MISLTDLTNLDDFIAKIDFGLLTKICLEIIFYFAVLYFAKKLVGIFFNKILEKIQDHEIKRQYSTIHFLCLSVVNIIIFLFFATNILGDMGIDMKPILATAGVFGVAIGFGAKRFVEDIISGLVILLSGQVRVGDFVSVNGSTGTVEKINLAMIKIRAYCGDVHYVRNGLVDKVVNHTRDFSQPVVNIPVAYEANIGQVIDVLRGLCNDIRKKPEFADYILDEPEIVAIDSFDDSSIGLKVRFKTTPMQQWAVQRYFRIMVKKKFDELDISIPFNQLDVHVLQNT